jgi:hypothetical protein
MNFVSEKEEPTNALVPRLKIASNPIIQIICNAVLMQFKQ